jgi:nucleotide-binding universal stress UspA family protein
MKMLICSIGSKQCQATLRFGSEVAKAVAADSVLLGMGKREQDVEELQGLLAEVARGLTDLGLSVQVRVEVGDPEQTVMAEVERTAYDLVAIGALGGQRSRRTLLDSVGMRIMERATGSVLVIKGDRSQLARVLICSSGTEHSRLPVQIGSHVACGAGAGATLLHVMDPMPIMYAGLEEMEETLPELLQTETEQARELRWAVGALEAECQNVELKLRQGVVADEVLQEARAGDYDLIVLGSSRAARGIVRVLLGDLTHTVVSRAQRPVLVARSSSLPETTTESPTGNL